jgi:ABC-type Mn2+/Zn2+ transport system ATPase subunit
MQKSTENTLHDYIQSSEPFIPPISAISIGALTGAKIGTLVGAKIGALIGTNKGAFAGANAGALAGANAGRLYGAAIGGVIGFAFGVIDNLLIRYKITSRHYLTTANLGAGMMSPFQLPHNAGEIGGFVVGGLIPTGCLNSFTAAVQPVTNAAIMAKFAGQKFPLDPYAPLYGAAAGATITLADEALIYLNVTDKRYLSTTAVIASNFDFMIPKFNAIIGWVASLNGYTLAAHTSITAFLNSIPYISLGTGIMFGAYAANKTEVKVLDWKPITLGNELIKTYGRVIDEEALKNIMELSTITTITNQLLFHNIELQMGGIEQSMDESMASLGTKDIIAKIAIRERYMKDLLIYGVVILPPYILSVYVNSISNHYFSTKLGRLVEDALRHEWLQNNTALKLSNMESVKTLLHHKKADIATLASSGTLLIAHAFSKATGGIIGAVYAWNNAMDVLVYALLYDKLTSSVSQSIAENINEYTDRIRDSDALIDTIEKDITNNAETITARGGIPYHLDKLTELANKTRVFVEKQISWDILHGMWLTLKNMANGIIFNKAIRAYKISIGELDFDVRYKLSTAVDKAFSAISFKMDNTDWILNIEKSIESINKLIDAMRDTTTTELYHTEYKQGKFSIRLTNFTVYLQEDGRVLLDSITIEFLPGIYSIKGDKGSGKSMSLKKLFGLDGNGGIGIGNITITTPDGTQEIRIFIPQRDHFPLTNMSFLELLNYPYPLPSDSEALAHLTQKAQELWSHLGEMNTSSTKEFDKFMAPDHPRNWKDILSGGQAKAAIVISVLLQTPDPLPLIQNRKPLLLILDEAVSTALDPRSTKVIKEAIKDFCAERKCIILSIDHSVANNNCTDKNLEFLKTILALDKISKSWDPSGIIQMISDEGLKLSQSDHCVDDANVFYDYCLNLTGHTLEPCW